MMKKLFLLADLSRTGGIQRYNRYLYNALRAEFGKYSCLTGPLSESPGPLKKLSFVFKTAMCFLVKRPKILICGHVDLSPLALFFKIFFNARYTVLTHGIEVWNLHRGIKYKGLNSADLITAVSRYTKDRMVANGIVESKIKLLQNTVDARLFHRKAKKKELLKEVNAEDKRVLLTVGRVSSQERYKGHDVMLEALRLLSDEYVWLVIGGGDDLPRLRHKAENLGVMGKVRFLKRVKDKTLVDYYNLCDCFVMPSSGEGFGIVFLEAMACGKPVIGGSECGSAEPLMGGKLGFMIRPDNLKEITHAIHLACTAKEERTDAEYLMREVKAKFGMPVFNKKVRQIFSEILQ